MGASCAEKLIRVKILSDVDQYFQIGASVGDQDRVETLLFLIQNVDVCLEPIWGARIDPEFIIHKLNVDPSFPQKKQKLRRSAKEHIEVVR